MIRIKMTCLLLFKAAFIGLLFFSGCGEDDNATGNQNDDITGIAIHPESATIETGEQLEFTAFAISSSGDTIESADLDIEWDWWSSDPDIFTVDNSGTVTANGPGEAYCMLETNTDAGKFTAKLMFVGRDSAFVFVF